MGIAFILPLRNLYPKTSNQSKDTQYFRGIVEGYAFTQQYTFPPCLSYGLVFYQFCALSSLPLPVGQYATAWPIHWKWTFVINLACLLPPAKQQRILNLFVIESFSVLLLFGCWLPIFLLFSPTFVIRKTRYDSGINSQLRTSSCKQNGFAVCIGCRRNRRLHSSGNGRVLWSLWQGRVSESYAIFCEFFVFFCSFR